MLPYIGPRREISGQGASSGGGGGQAEAEAEGSPVSRTVVRISCLNGWRARCVVFSLHSAALIAIYFQKALCWLLAVLSDCT